MTHTCVNTATTYDGRLPPPCPACLLFRGEQCRRCDQPFERHLLVAGIGWLCPGVSTFDARPRDEPRDLDQGPGR